MTEVVTSSSLVQIRFSFSQVKICTCLLQNLYQKLNQQSKSWINSLKAEYVQRRVGFVNVQDVLG